MEKEPSENNTPQKDIQALSLKDKKTKMRNPAKEKQYASLTINITPVQYRGMHLLGNFKQGLSWNPRQSSELRDHRLTLLPPSLFLNRTVLDVGCGQGKLAIEIAMRFFPLKMVALDLDAKLLERANKLIDKIVDKNELYSNRQEIVLKKIKELPLYFQQQFAKNHQKAQIVQKVQIMTEGPQFKSGFPDNFFVYNQNVMNIKDTKYDTIIIMGTSKWIHLALGDNGLTALFQKVYELLNENGILVLQYPLYRSYQKKKNMNSLYSYNMKHNINIDPLTIPSLLSHMGFDFMEEIMSKPQHALKHPIALFRRKNIENSQP